MKDPIVLIDAILDSYDNQSFLPANGVTHCNEALHMIGVTVAAYDKFYGLTADQIIDYIVNNASEWQPVAMTDAQAMANEGSWLVAGLKSTELGQAHGHVVTIRPGREVYSGKWGSVPRVLNIGAQNFIARSKTGPLTNQPCGLNESFIPMPKIYALKSTL